MSLDPATASSLSILSKVFPPPSGPIFTSFSHDDLYNVHNVCLCDVAGRSFVGKGPNREVARVRSADAAVSGLGLALVHGSDGAVEVR